jgi:hypothetical protein
MRAHLVFPDESIAFLWEGGIFQKSVEKLRWKKNHPDSRDGAGVLVRPELGDLLHPDQFRVLRDLYGARLKTTHPQRAARALGVPSNEPGIEAVPS